ncbi:hypothetical protein Mapa_004519 [Marchantia paleacea]|nr:hypothetical protein Mapa_004519 [Marchantia paleacea]
MRRDIMQQTLAAALVMALSCLQCLVRAATVSRPGGICEIFVLPRGYACDERQVQTDDGFLLGVQRVSSSAQSGTTARKPVFLYHGMLSGGESWLLNERDNSLPLILADAGYDVWIGNTRTTDFSYGHTSASREDQEFWDWSTDDLVAHDLPIMLQLVYASTNQTAHYVGFSQGTQVAVAGFVEGHVLPFVDRVVLLAPVVRVDTIKSAMGIAAGLFLVDQMMLLARIWEFNAHLQSGEKLLNTICGYPNAHCYDDYISTFTGANCCLNETRRAYYEEYETQSTATKNLAHFAQQYRTNSFAKYDYGWWNNLFRYHSLSPPEYDLRRIPAMPLLLVHGGTDGLADADDVQLFLNSITFSPQVLYLPDYGHLDFLVGTRSNIDIYPTVLDFLTQPTA